MVTSTPTTIETGQLPSATMVLLSNSDEQAEFVKDIGNERGTGLVTADSLIKILLYVRSSKKLPKNLDEFVKDIGRDNTGINGMEPSEIITLYNRIRDHANRWTPVEAMVKSQASEITIASEDIVRIGDTILELINMMDVITQLDNTVGFFKENIPITSEKDKKIHTTLPEIIRKLKQTCVKQKEKSKKVYTAVSDYRMEIIGSEGIDGIQPDVQLKKKRAKETNLDNKIVALQNSIDNLETQIAQLNKDYTKYTGLAFTGIVGGPLGLLITGSIFGLQANDTRKKRNKLIKQKEKKDTELQNSQQIQGILNKFLTQFTDLDMCLEDTHKALEGLELLWNVMVLRIENTIDKWMEVKNSNQLYVFKTSLEDIVDPWRNIGDMSVKLFYVFEKAHEEFQKLYEA